MFGSIMNSCCHETNRNQGWCMGIVMVVDGDGDWGIEGGGG